MEEERLEGYLYSELHLNTSVLCLDHITNTSVPVKNVPVDAASLWS